MSDANTDWPEDGENPHTFHDLSYDNGKVKKMWYWTGAGWCTKPNSLYIIKTPQMKAIGWIYLRMIEKI
jgi:hypothetical protein